MTFPRTGPKHLPPSGKQEWARARKILEDNGRLKYTNVRVFELYCETYARYVEASEWVTKTRVALLRRDPDGNPITIKNEFMEVLESSRRQMLELIERLGLEDLEHKG